MTARPRGGYQPDAVLSAATDLCDLYGVMWRHEVPAKIRGNYLAAVTGPAAYGWPDLVLYGPGGLMLRECKGDKSQLTANQRKRHKELKEAGIGVDVWRPADVHSGRVAREIKALSRKRG